MRIPTGVGGPHVAFVHPESPELVPAGPEPFDADVNGVVLRVVLKRWTSLPVRVQLRDGAPLAGARVELVRPCGELSVHRETRSFRLSDPFGSRPGGDVAFQVDEAVTDAAGTARLRAPAAEGGLAVRVLGPRCLVQVVEGVTVAAAGTPPVVVVVELAGTLTVRVLGSEALQRFRANPPFATCAVAAVAPERTGPWLTLTRSGLPRNRTPAPETSWQVGSDGRVTIEGIAPGDWEVHLACWTTLGSTDSLLCFSPDRPLLTVRFDGGEAKSAELDARPHAPGRVEGRLLSDGEPVPHAHLQLKDGRWDGRAHQAWGWLTDAEGRFTLDPVPPGSFDLVVDELDPATGGWTKDYFWRLPLEPGGTLRRDFVIALRHK